MAVTTTTPKQYTTALLAILSILICGLSSSSLVSASSLLTDPDNNHEQLDFKLLLPRSILEGNINTNDEDYTTVQFNTFSLLLKGISTGSELAKSTETPINNSNPRSAIMNAIQLFVNTKGYEAFENSELYNERFVDMNVGNVYSVLYEEGKDLPWKRGRSLLRHNNGRNLQETAAQPTTTGTSKITLGHEGQSTFTGLPHYYSNDPTSTNITNFLTDELNKDENLLELQNILKPMICTQDELSTNTCYLEVGGFTSDVLVEDDETEEDEETIDKSEIEDPTTNEDTSKLAWIIPVVVGSSLLAIAIISLLFIKHRNKNSNDDDMMQHAVEVKASNTAESEFTEEVEVTASGDIMSKDSNGSNSIAAWAGAKSPLAAMAAASTLVASTTSSARSRSWSRSRSKSRSRSSSPSNEAAESTNASADAYDAIMSPGLTSSVVAAPPTAAAIVGTAAVAAAVASKKESSEKEKEEEKKSKKTKNIDNILDEFDDSSSFITDSSADNTSVSGSVSTGYIGLIAENQPLDDIVHTSSRLSQVSTDNSVMNSGGGGYLPKSLTTKDPNKESSTTRKQESFEDDYRTRSAMAKLNLKKDILHVACETHDAPTDAARTGGDDEDPNVPLIGSAATAAGVANGSSKGVSRTISAKKNTSMLDAQRISDKLSMKGYTKRSSKRGNSKEREDDSSSLKEEKDLILPVDFQRSDSVGDMDSEDGSSGSDEETTTDYSTLT